MGPAEGYFGVMRVMVGEGFVVNESDLLVKTHPRLQISSLL